MGYSPWGGKESDTTERLSTNHSVHSAELSMESVLNVPSPMDGLKALHMQP